MGKKTFAKRDIRMLHSGKSSLYFEYSCGFPSLQHCESHRFSKVLRLVNKILVVGFVSTIEL